MSLRHPYCSLLEPWSRLSTPRLMSIPGVGPLNSTGMVAAIGTDEAFDRERDFGAWLGPIPRQYSMGGRAILGRISKRSHEARSRSFNTPALGLAP
jgi:transposase